MNFYNNTHPYYCGIDLHARSLYVCIIDQQGNKCLHKNIPADPDKLLHILKPYAGNIVVGVECMHCWYWVADFCSDHHFDFILGHALYMKAIHGGKAKNDRIDSFKIATLIRGGNFPLAYTYPKAMRATRDLLRRRSKIVRHGAQLKAHVANTTSQYNLPPNKVNLRNRTAREKINSSFDDPVVQRSMDLNMTILDCYSTQLSKIEWFLEQQAKQHNPVHLHLLKSIYGIGRILALTILYEIGDISRFSSVQQFASYARLVKCKAKSLSVLAHKLGRCVYFMLKNETVFDEHRFLKS